jgi:hypothetical protein
MTDDPVPADVYVFIQRYIDSVAQLEAILLLRSTPDQGWDAAGVAKRLYAPEGEIAEVLSRLAADSLIVFKDGLFRYDCPADLRRKVDDLAGVYARHLIAVTNIIHAKPRRIREFADAFKFRKDR